MKILIANCKDKQKIVDVVSQAINITNKELLHEELNTYGYIKIHDLYYDKLMHLLTNKKIKNSVIII